MKSDCLRVARNNRVIAIKILATRLPTKPRLYWLTLSLAGFLAIYLATSFPAVFARGYH